MLIHPLGDPLDGPWTDTEASRRVEHALSQRTLCAVESVARKAGVSPQFARRVLNAMVDEGRAIRQRRERTNSPAFYRRVGTDEVAPLYPSRPGEDARLLAACLGGLSYPRGTSWLQ